MRGFSLRVSVLENCQYQCPYCLPGTIKPFASKPSWLSVLEYQQIAEGLASLPITKVRFTGGEPLIRQNVCEIIDTFHQALPNAVLSLTTNAQYLQSKLASLLKSGVSRLNVHIDTLDPVKYKRIMGNGDVNQILAALPDIKNQVEELKINVVLQKGVNDDELTDFIEYSKNSGIEVRFIELMNTGSAKSYVEKTFLAGADGIAMIAKSYGVRRIGRRHLSDPAEIYAIDDLKVHFGLIASDTQPFCADCNRLRLNAQGELRGCLYQPEGVALGSMLRSGTLRAELLNSINAAVKAKKSFHPMVSQSQYQFSMAEIGG